MKISIEDALKQAGFNDDEIEKAMNIKSPTFLNDPKTQCAIQKDIELAKSQLYNAYYEEKEK